MPLALRVIDDISPIREAILGRLSALTGLGVYVSNRLQPDPQQLQGAAEVYVAYQGEQLETPRSQFPVVQAKFYRFLIALLVADLNQTAFLHQVISAIKALLTGQAFNASYKKPCYCTNVRFEDLGEGDVYAYSVTLLVPGAETQRYPEEIFVDNSGGQLLTEDGLFLQLEDGTGGFAV